MVQRGDALAWINITLPCAESRTLRNMPSEFRGVFAFGNPLSTYHPPKYCSAGGDNGAAARGIGSKMEPEPSRRRSLVATSASWSLRSCAIPAENYGQALRDGAALGEER